MIEWGLEKPRLEKLMPWFLSPSSQFIYSNNNNSPLNSFMDYIYPVVDRLSLTFNAHSLLDYYNFHSNRASHINISLSIQNRMSKTFNCEYQLLSCLGKGGFGQVYDGRQRSNNSSVVVKILSRNRIINWEHFKAYKRVPYEVEILWRLRGISGIIRIFEHFEEPDRFIFTMEKIPILCTLSILHVFREIIRINITLQNYSVWHGDCKPENIIYCKTDRSLRFIDFGSAAPVQSEDFHEFQGTLEIMVPEWILEKRYNGEQVCVWTLDICLYFLLFQQYPFRSKPDIINGRSQLLFMNSTDEQTYRTMRQCLNSNGYRRPKLNNLLQLSWLR
ncbi:unnamed protein product [Rotaria magnacalcarata]|uniref:non-specific serine/threonine protein kinase n=1 Tax=Rotaria magnacalcarata TaxID=392030 RepID=A0A816LKI6_9BILA|nr:unnamed protein product [Rotaria magnacalcarata]CAF2105358.1 unnamed protein product [Rotaria magnacalcarata]